MRTKFSKDTVLVVQLNSKLDEFRRIELKADTGQSTLTEYEAFKSPLVPKKKEYVPPKKEYMVTLMTNKDWFDKLLTGKVNFEIRDWHILRYNLHSGNKILLMCGHRNVVAEILEHEKGTMSHLLQVIKFEWDNRINGTDFYNEMSRYYPKLDPKVALFVAIRLKVLKETLHDH